MALLWPSGSPRRSSRGNHDLDLSVHDCPVGALEGRVRELSVECPLEKIYDARRATDDQVRRDRVMTSGNGIYCHRRLLASGLQLACLDNFTCRVPFAKAGLPMCNAVGPARRPALSLGLKLVAEFGPFSLAGSPERKARRGDVHEPGNRHPSSGRSAADLLLNGASICKFSNDRSRAKVPAGAHRTGEPSFVTRARAA